MHRLANSCDFPSVLSTSSVISKAFSVQTSSRRALVLELMDFFLSNELSLLRFDTFSLVFKKALAASSVKTLTSSFLSVSNNCFRFSGDLTLLKRISISVGLTSFGSCISLRHELVTHLVLKTIHFIRENSANFIF